VHQGRTPAAKSASLRARAVARTPGGVHSNVRLTAPEVFIKRARGAWMWDVDGRDYVDYLLGQGPNFLGHAPPPVLAAVEAACRDGMVYGGQHPLEVAAAEAFCDAVGWAEMVRFGVSGTESVHAAVRLARAATGREKVIRFQGHYHGWLDDVLIAEHDGVWGPASAGQPASRLAELVVLPWNDPDAVTGALNQEGASIAAVIMEPVMINSGVIEPQPGYLERVRELCTRHGVVLIFDEVISGFRVALGGAAARYGVTPDLATYGKAMAGGWPAAALAGRAELMKLLSTGTVNHSGTFNSSVMAMAATVATIGQLRENPPYEGIAKHGTALMSGIHELGLRHGLPLHIQGLPAAFHCSFGTQDATDYQSLARLDRQRYAKLAADLVRQGIWVAGRGVWYVSASHGDQELDAALTRFERALSDGGS
jgi:glutamate-1-semialdehyde 2,1-aminomutase